METKDEMVFLFKLNVREVIPLLRLPSNKKEYVSTWDLKQLKNLVIFFNHGVKCVQCRAKVKALATAYSQMKLKLGTEVLAVSFNS